MNRKLANFLQLLLAASALVSVVQGQQDFTTAEVPNPFRVGDFYPPRPEVEVCRPIRDYIDRNSARFTNELVTNTNADITFSTSDSRIMSSRMQSRLNSLASLYRQQTGRRMTVLRAWSQFPDAQINDDKSLHYEGELHVNIATVCTVMLMHYMILHDSVVQYHKNLIVYYRTVGLSHDNLNCHKSQLKLS